MSHSFKKNKQVHFAILNDKYQSHALKAYKALSDENIPVYWNYKFNLKKSLSKSNESKASYVVIVGEDEFSSEQYTLKNLDKGTQKSVTLFELIKHFKNG